MIECLKEQKKQLSQRCHQRIFRLQEVEMSDPELDYQLMRVCKQMIKVWRRFPMYRYRVLPDQRAASLIKRSSAPQRFCTEADARTVLQCLKQNKNSELMDPKCKQMITKRQITQNTGEGAAAGRGGPPESNPTDPLLSPVSRLQAQPGTEESVSSRHPKVLPEHPEQGERGQRAGGPGDRLPQTQIRRPGQSASGNGRFEKPIFVESR